MNKEEIKKIIEQIDNRLILTQAIKEPVSSDLDKMIKLSVAYEELQNNWNELKEELKREFQEYYCGWHAQDMATVYRVSEHLEVLDKIITKMESLESRK